MWSQTLKLSVLSVNSLIVTWATICKSTEITKNFTYKKLKWMFDFLSKVHRTYFLFFCRESPWDPGETWSLHRSTSQGEIRKPGNRNDGLFYQDLQLGKSNRAPCVVSYRANGNTYLDHSREKCTERRHLTDLPVTLLTTHLILPHLMWLLTPPTWTLMERWPGEEDMMYGQFSGFSCLVFYFLKLVMSHSLMWLPHRRKTQSVHSAVRHLATCFQ